MAYRIGAYVVDTRENRIAQVIGNRGSRAQVRQPGGGLEWEVPFPSLRLANRTEREEAEASAPGSLVGCTECVDLEAARREAVASGEEEAAVDATIAVRSHFRDAHLLSGRSW